jgi:hypothetical protein
MIDHGSTPIVLPLLFEDSYSWSNVFQKSTLSTIKTGVLSDSLTSVPLIYNHVKTMCLPSEINFASAEFGNFGFELFRLSLAMATIVSLNVSPIIKMVNVNITIYIGIIEIFPLKKLTRTF